MTPAPIIAQETCDPVHVPAGFLMPDTEAAIVDDFGCSCGPGEAGELLIRSRYNALGEWERGRVSPGR
jgi:non-ribosomal peptide synthetase component F